MQSKISLGDKLASEFQWRNLSWRPRRIPDVMVIRKRNLSTTRQTSSVTTNSVVTLKKSRATSFVLRRLPILHLAWPHMKFRFDMTYQNESCTKSSAHQTGFLTARVAPKYRFSSLRNYNILLASGEFIWPPKWIQDSPFPTGCFKRLYQCMILAKSSPVESITKQDLISPRAKPQERSRDSWISFLVFFLFSRDYRTRAEPNWMIIIGLISNTEDLACV